jgi:16S rRNA (uracil1498-N3)-methyltransferase
MPRFFVPARDVEDGRAVIRGDDAAHLARSLRAAPGEQAVVADDAGREHGVRLESVSAERVEGVVEWSRAATGEPRLEVHVVQAIAKEGMDELIEALAEVGAAAIWPVVTRRTVVRLDERRAEHRVARWNAIARGAAGLAGRARPPVVHPVRGLDEIDRALPEGVRLVACTTDAALPLAHVLGDGASGATSIAVVVGPEGGLDPAEVTAQQEAGATTAHLGPRVLRARLAGVIAVSTLLGAAGDLDTPVAGWPTHVGSEATTR